jgi:fluoride ion exporter CrcB/FEX
LLVNVVGSFLLGLLHDVHPPVSTVLAVGGLGAFTTFSSFTSDAVALVGAR